MKNSLFLLFLFLSGGLIIQAQDTINKEGYTVFYYENGIKSSEGIMKNGKPDGYWKTYNKEGILVSEGNRLNFLLDSTWKFYSDSGKLFMEVSYKNGLKNGKRIIYQHGKKTEEIFINDVKEGITKIFYKNGQIKKIIPFRNGLENGLSKEYDKDGRIITLITYEKGFITEREKINRYDQQGKKHGKWKTFYDNGVLWKEGTYKHGLKHGYFKEFDKKGNLLSTQKYKDNILQEDVAELAKLDIVKEYYPSGKVKIVASYKNEIPEGVTRKYDSEGNIEKATIFKNGILIGEGLMTEKGEKDSYWKEYYDSGKIKAEGDYNADKRTGNWKFYHENGKIEQTGNYDKEGRYTDVWKWYDKEGNLIRVESFYRGKADGLMTEYDQKGNIIAKGEYIDGLENGFWTINYGDINMEGNYVDGLRNGNWKYFHKMGELLFEGDFIDDNPNGKHRFYWPNGKIKEEGNYIMGRKDGEWKKYNADGTLFMTVYYENGREQKLDGIKISLDQ